MHMNSFTESPTFVYFQEENLIHVSALLEITLNYRVFRTFFILLLSISSNSRFLFLKEVKAQLFQYTKLEKIKPTKPI